MRYVAIGAITATLWAVSAEVALAFLGLACLVAVFAATRTPAYGRKAPTPKTHRWVPGLGLGLTPHGPFPFVTIYRRRR